MAINITFLDKDIPLEDIDITKQIESPLEDIDITNQIESPLEEFDITKQIESPLEKLDITKQIESPLEELDITKQIESPLEEFDITNQIESPLEEFDITKQIESPLEELNITKQIDIPLEDIDITKHIESPLEELDITKHIKQSNIIGGSKETGLNFFEHSEYKDYIIKLSEFFKWARTATWTKGTKNKYSKNGNIFEKNPGGDTILMPIYKDIALILKHIFVSINEEIYNIQLSTNESDKINEKGFVKSKERLINLIQYKERCSNVLTNKINHEDNQILLIKKISIKQSLSKIMDQIKLTDNKEDKDKLIEEYLKLNTLLSLEKGIRENNGNRFLWNDPSFNDPILRYDKLVIEKPKLKIKSPSSKAKLKIQSPSSKPKLKIKSPSSKPKLKIKSPDGKPKLKIKSPDGKPKLKIKK